MYFCEIEGCNAVMEKPYNHNGKKMCMDCYCEIKSMTKKWKW